MMAARRSGWSALLPLIVVAIELSCAWIVLGVPDLGAVRRFLFAGSQPTGFESVSAAQAALWIVVLVTLAGAVLSLVRYVLQSSVVSNQGAWTWALLAAAAGAVILTAGATVHASRGGLSMAGGSVQEASKELAR